MFYNKWMDKQTVVYPYHKILLSNEKEQHGWISGVLCWMKKDSLKGHVIYNSII